MKVEVVSVGYIGTNCYILYNEGSDECVIVDPGDNAEKIIGKVTELGLLPIAILLTHGHFDHVGALDEIREHYNIKAYCGENEKETLENRRLSLGARSYSADCFFKDGEEVTLSGFKFKVLETPGHTMGGVCYYFENDALLLSGDSLFHESVGRTDLKGGAVSDLINSLKEKIMTLPDDTRVLPGHMDATTIGHERVYNPFLV